MSKIGKKPITIPESVSVKMNGGVLEIVGKKGNLSLKILPYIKVDLKDNVISVNPEKEFKQAVANWGTMRALIQNAVSGVNEGFSKTLEIEGVGYRATMDGSNLSLSLGFSHPVKFVPPQHINIVVEKNAIKISGIDKAMVGQTAAKIRALKKPEPYKGKGIKYQGEIIRRKEGKKAASAAK